MTFKRFKSLSALFALILAAGLLTGCKTTASRDSRLRVEPFTGPENAELSGEQTAELCSQAGLDRDQILQYGTAIRNALASQGACRIYQNQRVLLIMAVQDERVYVSQHTGSTFIFDLDDR